MTDHRASGTPRFALHALAVLAMAFFGAAPVAAFGQGSDLPATPPTSLSGVATRGPVAPIAAAGTSTDRAGKGHHRAQVSCANGQLAVHADNSSLNGILRSISQCTGMRISGGVADQRVFGDYGPAAPSTVLATLLDGTGTNMILQETASAQPATLILTPRTGGVTPPGPATVLDDDPDENNAAASQPGGGRGGYPAGSPPNGVPINGQGVGFSGSGQGTNPNVTPVPQPYPGSAVTGPVPIPLPTNNVNGSPNNVSPTASSYPTTNSVSLDSLPTPSTTPSSNGIVDAPNPPAPGSDTSRLLQGVNSNQPGTTDIVPGPTSGSTLPGGTNTTTPVPTGAIQPGADSTGNPPNPTGALTPQQVYQQLQQIRAQGGQGTAPSTPPPAQTPPFQTAPQ